MVNEKIKNYYSEVLTVFGKLFRRLVFDIFKDNFEEYWQAIYNNATDTNRTEKDNGFFKGICQHSDDQSIYNKSDEEKFKISLSWTLDERMGIFDEAVLLKQIAHIPFVSEAYRKKYNTKMSANDIEKISKRCNSIRNSIAHFDSSDPKGILTQKKFNDFIQDVKKLTSFCKSNADGLSDEINWLYSDFCRICDDLSEKAGYPPIEAEEFADESGYDVENIIEICNKNNIEYIFNEFGKRYILSISKEKLIHVIASENIEERLNNISADYNNLSNKFNQIAAIVGSTVASSQTDNGSYEVNTSKTYETQKNRPTYVLQKLKCLKNYQKGYLSDSQLEELCLRYNVFADASAFLNDSSRKFITKILIPAKTKLVKGVCPIWIHRAARNEIYELAKSEISTEYYSDEEVAEFEFQKSNAKTAMKTINELRNRGLINIIGNPTYDETSCSMLLNLLDNYKDRRFCIVTQDNYFAEAVADTEIKTLCALKVVGSRSIIWSATVENLHCDHTEYINAINSGKEFKIKTADEEEDNQTTYHSQNTKEVVHTPYTTTKQQKVQEQKHVDSISSAPAQSSNFIKLHKQSDTVYDEFKNPIKLLEYIADGGEGTVYATQNQNVVAKIYHLDKRNETQLKKLNLMVSKKPSAKNIAWPQSILYDKNGNFVGFTMNRISAYCKQLGESVLMINNNKVREKYIPDWNREDLVKLCLAISETFSILHQKNVLMGDINPANILINPNNSSEVYFVDCDSYQIGEFLCTVGTPIFTSPDYYLRCNKNPKYAKEKRTAKDEAFALATLLFEVLMNGQAPFASKSTEKSDIINDICNHRFSFKTRSNSGSDTPVGPYRMIWNNLHPVCKNNFSNVFEDNKTVYDSVWIDSFKKYIADMQTGKYSKDLFPKKYLDFNGDFVDFTCSCCGADANMHKDQHADIAIKAHELNREPIFLCNECRTLMNDTITEDFTVCEICGKHFYAKYGDLWRNQKYGFKIKCDDCKNRRR